MGCCGSSIMETNSTLDLKDTLTSIKARLGIGRMHLIVKPGLYKLGNPDNNSNVFVTSNYKLTFNHLRSSLDGINAYILVLNTSGVNVWCAANKGTFGTKELIRKIKESNLSQLVDHKKIIVPQLGGPGIEAHIVTKETGFKVIYGPVRATDIKDFIKNDLTATKKMREVEFNLFDRIAVSFVELKYVLKYSFFVFLILLAFNFFQSEQFLINTLKEVIPYVFSIFSAVFIFPILLPFLTGRSFSFKGFVLGGLTIAIYNFFAYGTAFTNLILYLTALPIVSFISMNFTGSTTFTSLSGVIKEMKIYIPVMIVFELIGIVLRILKIVF